MIHQAHVDCSSLVAIRRSPNVGSHQGFPVCCRRDRNVGRRCSCPWWSSNIQLSQHWGSGLGEKGYQIDSGIIQPAPLSGGESERRVLSCVFLVSVMFSGISCRATAFVYWPSMPGRAHKRLFSFLPSKDCLPMVAMTMLSITIAGNIR